MAKLLLNKETSIDLSKLIESRLLVQANSGGGKSWAIRRLVEQAVGKVQIIILDPEGEFTNLREKFDFVYAGKDGDAPVESRSAALLARRLLELKASAIVDLYELPPQERKKFVRFFCEALVNAPKELWHDCLIIIDEAHVFAPEKGESEAMGPVIDLATRGRKRGYCVVLATQRLPKLNKDAAAECNNKLIGRASQDIDRKRASEELGFTTKEQILSLRDLEPGEFYAFGPAISRDVRKIVIGDVAVKPPPRGVSKKIPPPPTGKVKKILAQLANLPKEAEQEARTAKELKDSLAVAKRRIKELEKGPKDIVDLDYTTKAVATAVKETERRHEQFKKKLFQALLKSHGDMHRALTAMGRVLSAEIEITSGKTGGPIKFEIPKSAPTRVTYTQKVEKRPEPQPTFTGEIADINERPLSKGARAVLSYLHSVRGEWKTKAQLWVATGYAPGGGFNNIIYELTGVGLVEKDSTGKYKSAERHDPAMVDESFEPSLSKWDTKLSLGARKIFHLLLERSDQRFTKEYIAQETGYALGGGFNNLIYELTGKELAVKSGTEYMINPEILDL